jgi:4-diphosphocytidyl-2-C-methyl-D-erythritol kinase
VRSVIYHSYAKINLYLDVLDKRPDGYHNIETVFQTVGLHDEMEFTPHEGEISLDCTYPDLATGEENLAYRAAALLKQRSGTARGVHIYIVKRIPISAGLGGGSSNAATALLVLNDLWECNLSNSELAEIALELGSDVPYFLQGGAMGALGRGEELFPIASMPPAWFVLLHPGIELSTRTVYSHPALEKAPERPSSGRTAIFDRALDRLARGDWAVGVYNRMEDAVLPDHPELKEAKDLLGETGCAAVAMSGSGPTLFGVCNSQAQALTVAARCGEHRVSVVEATPHGSAHSRTRT